jgi:hypothetical protein
MAKRANANGLKLTEYETRLLQGITDKPIEGLSLKRIDALIDQHTRAQLEAGVPGWKLRPLWDIQLKIETHLEASAGAR